MVIVKTFEGLKRGEARVQAKTRNIVLCYVQKKVQQEGYIYKMYWRLNIYQPEGSVQTECLCQAYRLVLLVRRNCSWRGPYGNPEK